MFKRSWLAVAVLMLPWGTLFWAQTRRSDDLPPGNMRDKARTACMECHDSGILVQQRLNKAAWTKEVDKMVKWGAVVDPNDREALIDYLSASFPPEKPAAPAPKVARGK